MGKKTVGKKMRLAKENKKIRRLPQFVILRTKGRITYNKNRRDWRTDKLRIADE